MLKEYGHPWLFSDVAKALRFTAERSSMSVYLLSRIELALPPHLFQPFARDHFDAGHCGLIVKIDRLQAQALDILVVGTLAEHFVSEDLFGTPQA